MRSGCALRLPPLHRGLGPRRFCLLPGLGLIPDRRWNHLFRRGISDRHLVSYNLPWKASGVHNQGQRDWRGREAYSYPPPQEFGCSPCPYVWGRDSRERYSFRDSQPEGVSDQVLKFQPALRLHLHVRTLPRIRREPVLDWD